MTKTGIPWVQYGHNGRWSFWHADLFSAQEDAELEAARLALVGEFDGEW